METSDLRKLKPCDLLEVSEQSIEERMITFETEDAEVVAGSGPTVTYFRNNKAVACCGMIEKDSVWHFWAIYSDRFTAITRCRAAVAFRKHFTLLLSDKRQETGNKATFIIPSHLPNGRKYARFIGGVHKETAPSRIHEHVTNDLYEVA